jgi:branched-chain amino acid transport system permease protein
MGIGLTLTYMTTRVPNFAHGSLVTVGVYTAFTLNHFIGLNPYESIPISFITAGLAALFIYIAILGPLARRGSSLVALMIATLAIDIAFIGVFGAYSDYLANVFKVYNSRFFTLIPADFRLMGIQGLLLVLPAFIALMTVTLYFFLSYTKFGTAMRASVENRNLASVLGINTGRVFKISWFLAGGLAGVAGSFLILWLPGDPSVGSDVIIAIFASSIVGGLTNIYGAILGGLLVGGSQILIATFVSQLVGTWFLTYENGIPLIVMIVALLVIPQGLASLRWRRLIGRR